MSNLTGYQTQALSIARAATTYHWDTSRECFFSGAKLSLFPGVGTYACVYKAARSNSFIKACLMISGHFLGLCAVSIALVSTVYIASFLGSDRAHQWLKKELGLKKSPRYDQQEMRRYADFVSLRSLQKAPKEEINLYRPSAEYVFGLHTPGSGQSL